MSYRGTHTTELNRKTQCPVAPMDWDVEVTVEYEITLGRKGTRVDGARFVEPDDPDELEILSVKDADGHEYELTESEDERIGLEIWAANDGV